MHMHMHAMQHARPPMHMRMHPTSTDARSVERLLALDADVTLTDASGCTPLHYCAERGDVQCAQALIDAGSSLEAVDQHGNTALHAAGRRGCKALFAHLIAAGVCAYIHMHVHVHMHCPSDRRRSRPQRDQWAGAGSQALGRARP